MPTRPVRDGAPPSVPSLTLRAPGISRTSAPEPAMPMASTDMARVFNASWPVSRHRAACANGDGPSDPVPARLAKNWPAFCHVRSRNRSPNPLFPSSRMNAHEAVMSNAMAYADQRSTLNRARDPFTGRDCSKPIRSISTPCSDARGCSTSQPPPPAPPGRSTASTPAGTAGRPTTALSETRCRQSPRNS